MLSSCITYIWRTKSASSARLARAQSDSDSGLHKDMYIPEKISTDHGRAGQMTNIFFIMVKQIKLLVSVKKGILVVVA